jgi:hypothetical protein
LKGDQEIRAKKIAHRLEKKRKKITDKREMKSRHQEAKESQCLESGNNSAAGQFTGFSST